MNNRRNAKEFIKRLKLTPNKLNLLLILALFLSFGLACNYDTRAISQSKFASRDKSETKKETASQPRRLETYTVRGLKFSYYLVPKQLSHDQLVAAAQQIHDAEPDAQLILVDDEAGVAEYVNYAKEISKGNKEVKFPKEWADEHIVGNVQKYLSGKWMLCESNGYKEIAQLK